MPHAATWRPCAARQWASSNDSPVCMMWSSIGTSFRAMAHTALTRRPPFRASRCFVFSAVEPALLAPAAGEEEELPPEQGASALGLFGPSVNCQPRIAGLHQVHLRQLQHLAGETNDSGEPSSPTGVVAHTTFTPGSVVRARAPGCSATSLASRVSSASTCRYKRLQLSRS